MNTRNLLIFLISYVLSFISYLNPYFLILHFIIFLYLIIKKIGIKAYFLGILIFVLRSFLITSFNDLNVDDVFYIYKKSNNYVYLINSKLQKVICYDFINNNLYSKIKIYGYLKEINSSSTPLIFDFKSFLASNNIKYSLEIIEFSLLNSGDSIQNEFFNHFMNNLSEKSNEMINLFLFAKKNNDSFYDNLIDINVVQLVVVSGFHFNLLSKYLEKIKIKYIHIFIIIFFLFYLYLLNFSIPACRAFVMYIFSLINRRYKLFTKSFSFLLTCILFLIFDPYLLLQVSFQLSFLATFLVLIISDFKINSFKMNIYISLGLFPLLVSMQNQINLLGFLYQFLLTIPISFIYMFSWVTLLFPFLDIIYANIVTLFVDLVSLISLKETLAIFPNLGITFIIVYYLYYLVFLCMRHLKIKKGINFSLVMIILIIFFEYQTINIYEEPSVTFLDVGQGDCTLISLGNNKGHILVDTGGSFTYDYATKRIIPYLKANGIRYLDKVIITHDDFDHNGALDSLVNNYDVKEIIDATKVNKVVHNDFVMKNLNKYYDNLSDDNDKSGVFIFSLCDYIFLLMGDASINIENKIIENNNLDIDIIKIGHHGSNTSSSYEFLEEIKGNIALISVGKYNNYGHPHKEVLKNLNDLNYRVLRTDLNGTIRIRKNRISLGNINKI